MLPDGQHVVNAGNAARGASGAAFTRFVMRVFPLNHRLTAAGEAIAHAANANQTLARWIVLETIADQPATVADIARRLGLARQGVQRLADALVAGGLATYEANPRHRRASLVQISPSGRQSLRQIQAVQRAWADRMAADLDPQQLEQTCAFIDRVLERLGQDLSAGARG